MIEEGLLDISGNIRVDALREAVVRISPDDLCTIIYTSGTTGPPKGSMLSVRNISFAADVLVVGGGLYDPPPNERDVTVSYLPLCHVVERAATIWVNAAAGTTVHFAESIDTVQANLREVQPTLFFAVPRIWEKLKAGLETMLAGQPEVRCLWHDYYPRLELGEALLCSFHGRHRHLLILTSFIGVALGAVAGEAIQERLCPQRVHLGPVGQVGQLDVGLGDVVQGCLAGGIGVEPQPADQADHHDQHRQGRRQAPLDG